MRFEIDGVGAYAATGGRPFDAAKPTVMFVHGAGMDHTVWQQPARWFAYHGWSVLAPDLPGHGRSGGEPLTSVAAMAAWVLQLRGRAGAGAAALVGHSMGGAIALEAAAADPARALGLVAMGTAAAIPVNPDLVAMAVERPAAAFDTMTLWGHGEGARFGACDAPGTWMLGATRALFGRNAAGVLATDLAACAAWNTGPAAAAKVTCPALVMTAQRDIMTPAKKGAALAGMIAGAKYLDIERVGHIMLAEAPDACLDALVGFLGKR